LRIDDSRTNISTRAASADGLPHVFAINTLAAYILTALTR
jgi:hypothetical protein